MLASLQQGLCYSSTQYNLAEKKVKGVNEYKKAMLTQIKDRVKKKQINK